MWQISRRILQRSKLFRCSLLGCHDATSNYISKSYFARGKQSSNDDVTKLFKPGTVKDTQSSSDAKELTGGMTKNEILKVLNKFIQNPQIRELCSENGLDDNIQREANASFRKYCFDMDKLPIELYIKLYDIIKGGAHSDDLFPYFLNYSREIFPHLNCMNDLKKISDLTNPSSWYPEARKKQRRIIFHSGPTNSGKTYKAMERFLSAKSGIYCGPLKLLAMEVFQKSNARGTPCDLVTGEERRFADPHGSSAQHVAITVEMAPVDQAYEVAVIDEIQLVKDPNRGWAWTRAFLGINADEVHVCGEAGAKGLLEKLCLSTGEILEHHHYNRLTTLTIEDNALESLSKLEPGDCIVCFNKNDIYAVTRDIEKLGKEVAVIYGSLPPNTKLTQAAKFNDPKNPCKIMVATDAIGMGLNLSIRRVIFYSVVKLQINEHGEREITSLSVSTALQIAGRAGRFGTQWEQGFVTTFRSTDLTTLKYLLSQNPEPITQAGLHPTADQIELYAYHLPNSTMSNLLDIFQSLSTLNDDLYFMCMIEDFKFLAEAIEHVSLPLRSRYVFCCAPVNRKQPFVCAMFSKFANQFSKCEPITFDYIAKNCSLPVGLPKTIADLVQLENIFDVMDIYLWLSYRFVDMFPHSEQIRDAQTQLDDLIQEGIANITKLIKDAEKNFQALNQKQIDPVRRITKEIEIDDGPESNERVSDYLLRKGILSEELLNKLQVELNGPKASATTIKTQRNSKNKALQILGPNSATKNKKKNYHKKKK